MSFGVAPFSVKQWLTTLVLRAIEGPGVWLTNLVDDAEDGWSTEPLLSDDHDLI